MKHHSKRLLDRVRDAIRLKGYSVRTEEAYADWIKRFILFHDKRRPHALLFLYREVLEKDLDGPIKAIRAKSAKRIPTVLTRQDLPRVLAVECSPSLSAYRIRTAWPHSFSTAAG